MSEEAFSTMGPKGALSSTMVIANDVLRYDYMVLATSRTAPFDDDDDELLRSSGAATALASELGKEIASFSEKVQSMRSELASPQSTELFSGNGIIGTVEAGGTNFCGF